MYVYYVNRHNIKIMLPDYRNFACRFSLPELAHCVVRCGQRQVVVRVSGIKGQSVSQCPPGFPPVETPSRPKGRKRADVPA
jgi:hypothetical protein